MFKVISESLAEGAPPFYLMMCDDPRCATMFQFPVPAEMSINPESKAIKTAQEEAWFISLGRILCPAHHRQLLDIENAGLGTKRVIAPSGLKMRNGKLVTQ